MNIGRIGQLVVFDSRLMPRADVGKPRPSQVGTSPDSIATVYIVADDVARAAQLVSSISGMGFRAQAFDSLAAYFPSLEGNQTGCVLYDGETCVSVLDALTATWKDGPPPPVVFLTDDHDIRVVVKAMRGGAVDFLFRRSCAESDLWEALQNATNRHAANRVAAQQRNERFKRLSLLSETEREILRRLVEGHNNRQIAEQLQLSRSAVEGRRTRLMRKLGIAHLPGLVKFVISVEG